MVSKKIKKPANPVNCDEIELSDINQIQPHGVWLALNKELCIIQYSENAPTYLSTPLKSLLTHSILEFLETEFSHDNVAQILTTPFVQYKPMLWIAPKKKLPILIFIHQSNGITTLEIERNAESTIQPSNSSSLFNNFLLSSMKKTEQCKSTEELAYTLCEEVKKLTNYHRVIVYQFDSADHTGLVIGEAMDKDMESYISLRFPATDIPAPVREMYMKMPIRYIPSILEKPLKIVSADPSQDYAIDLSAANLRMVASVHLKYLNNMGVHSALSVAIMQGGRLWGLIACHHREPKYLPQNYRATLLILANIFSAQSLSIKSAQDSNEQQMMGSVDAELADIFRHSRTLPLALASHHQELMKLVSSTGMSVYLHNVLLNYGETPEDKAIIKLFSWLDKQESSTMYCTDSLPLAYDAGMVIKHKACGILAMRITDLEHHYLLFYRPEFINTISWAGNPANIVLKGETYSPRDSFERFIEKIENHSAPWTSHDIQSAALIHSLVTTKQLQDFLQKQAMHDPLTQLLNRFHLEKTLCSEINRSMRGAYPLTIMLMDLDYFKKINDSFGHQAGDALLQSFAQLLKTEFRIYDYKYRYGGEEFLVILPNVNLEVALKKIQGISSKNQSNASRV